MKSNQKYVEGPEAFKAFEDGMKKVLALPKAELARRIEEERKRSAANPNKRGPKPKHAS